MSVGRIFALTLLGSGWIAAAVLWFQPPPEPSSPPSKTAQAEDSTDPLLDVVKHWSGASGFAAASLGVCILGPDGEKLAGFNDEISLVPASALKTVTTGAALELLGPDLTFETTVAAAAEQTPEGVIQGDIVLIGSGDPTLSADDLESLAEAVAATGVKSISGRIIADASAFPEAGASDHWVWGDVGNGFGAGIYGLNIGHNRYAARFDPADELGQPAKFLGSTPELPGVSWTNLVTTGAAGSGDGVMIHSGPYAKTITLRGTVPAGEPGFTVNGAVPDPPALAAHFFDAALRKRGITIAAEAQTTRGMPPPRAPHRLASHKSKPISEIIPHLHAVSDNVEAQSLFLKMGGSDAVRQLWQKRGVTLSGLRMEDGSGLARATRIRPADLARVNFLARHGQTGELFHASLSSSRGGEVRSKGGAMSGVRADVGFLTTAEGKEFTYAVIANGLARGADFWGFRDAVLDAADPSKKQDEAVE